MTMLLPRPSRIALTAAAALLVLVAAADGARALCAAQDLGGTFHNTNTATPGLTRIRLTFPCHDTGSRAGPDVWVEVWGKCHPHDCYWGRVRGRARWDPAKRQYTRVQVRFRPGFAVKTVVITRVDRRTIRVWHHTRFTDDSGRRNYFRWETLRK